MAKKTASSKSKPTSKKAAKSAAKSKAPSARPRPKFGDVFEIKLSDGRLAYFQFVNDDRRPPPGFSGNGPLIRVLAGTHKTRPADPSKLAEAEGEQFLIFFPLGGAAFRLIVERVGHAEVPARLQSFPRFKKFNEDYHTHKRLWYGSQAGSPPHFERIGPKLPREMLDDPLPHVANLSAVIDHIENGWTHRSVVRPEDIEEQG